MPYCPTCKRAYSTDTTECPTDRTPLVDELPFQTVDGDNATWVEMESVGTEEEARILQGFLEAEGVPAQFESLKFHEMPANLGKMGEVRIYVPAEHEREALELLRKRAEEYGHLRNEESIVTDDGPAEIDENEEALADSEKV